MRRSCPRTNLARRVDDRRVISGIVQVLKTGCRWRDCPSSYGPPPTTVYNRYRRWAGRGLWRRLFPALVQVSPGDIHLIDSTSAKAPAGGRRKTYGPPRPQGILRRPDQSASTYTVSWPTLAKMEIRASGSP